MTGKTQHMFRWLILGLVVATITAAVLLSTHVSSGLVSHSPIRPAGFAQISDTQPPTHPTTFEQATAARQAIRRGAFDEAQRIIAEELQASHMGRWHFAPFSDFLDFVTAPSDDAFAHQLNVWVAKDPRSATPYLVRGTYKHNLAWWIRGNGYMSSVDPDHGDTFLADAAAAASDLHEAVALDPKNPYARFRELLTVRDSGGEAAQEMAFQDAVKAFPDYYALYSVRLAELQPKWGGSIPAMYQFVSRYAGKATPNSPMTMLNLELYQHLVNAVSHGCRANGSEEASRCFDEGMARAATPAATQAAESTLAHFAQTGKADAIDELGGILHSMLSACGCQRFSLAMLTSAANGTGSDTQLSGSDTSKNNYMVDQLTAYFWFRFGNYANAELLDNRALADLRNTKFPSVNAGDAARASIYGDLASAANRQSEYGKVVTYQDAAAKLLGGYGSAPYYDRMACEALYRLKRYQEAIRTCTDVVNASRDSEARFFRARTYDAMGKSTAAVADYIDVAKFSSNNDFRTSAVIDLSVVYDNQRNYQDALDELNRYSDLFTEGRQDRSDLAIYYNNRCYNKMQLGAFKDALQDCNASIGYSPLPDAVKKQQELERKLGATPLRAGT